MADRTQEFFALARSIPATGAMSSIRGGAATSISSSTNGNVSQSSTDTNNNNYSTQLNQQHQQQQQQQQQNHHQQNPALQELRHFRQTAQQISHDVSTTSTLLAELSRLVKAGAGGTRMFADESANERADALVLRIKGNIEGLHSRLEEASLVLERSKRRLGKNYAQAGMEASNLVGQLKEDFVRTTSGFKAVLEQRSDGMKDAKDRKRRVLGGGEGEGAMGEGVGGEERVDLLTLMNKPAVYGGSHNHSNMDSHRTSSFGDVGMASGGGLGGGNSNNMMPQLDLTSGMMAMAQRHQDESMGGLPAGESSSQLPRPRELLSFVLGVA